MSKWISVALAMIGITFSQVAAALAIDLDISSTSADITLEVTDGSDRLFRLRTQFEGDAFPFTSDVRVLGALDGVPDSIIVEQRIQYTYMDGPYLTEPNFTPVLFADMDFFGDLSGPCPICENTYYDPISGAGYATENSSGQLDALYAVMAIGEGLQRTDVGDYDDHGVMSDRHASRIGGDSGINVGVSFMDPGLVGGDIVSVTYRHLFALGLQSVPSSFMSVPGPNALFPFVLGLALLLTMTAKNKRSGRVSY